MKETIVQLIKELARKYPKGVTIKPQANGELILDYDYYFSNYLKERLGGYHFKFYISEYNQKAYKELLKLKHHLKEYYEYRKQNQK